MSLSTLSNISSLFITAKELLKILKNVDKRILIISKNLDDILVKKYNSQYSNIEFKSLDIFHD